MIKKLFSAAVVFLGKIHWPAKAVLSAEEQEIIRESLVSDYFIIVTRRQNHFSTFMTGIAHFFLTGRWGYWSHVLMNVEDEVRSDADFRLIEAIGTGVQYTPFEQVFDCTAMALLKPKHVTLKEFTDLLDARAASYLGRKYDTLFDLKQDNEVSCVELIRDVLKTIPDYDTKFAAFEALISKRKNLDPQMFAECEDFELVYSAIAK